MIVLGFLNSFAKGELPKFYFSLNSLYKTASDYRAHKEFGASIELAGFPQYYSTARLEIWDDKRYALREKGFGLQTSLRRYPSAEIPGFFGEALLGYKLLEGANPNAGPYHDCCLGEGGFEGGKPDAANYKNHYAEAGFGFGYRLNWSRVQFIASFIFGPQILFRNSTLWGGAEESAVELQPNELAGGLLRFNQFEMGYAF